MDQLILISVTIFAGIFSQILAYRLRLPAIVPLLIFGGLLGQFHIIRPEYLGEGLHTIIQIGVAIILFEGGLSLRVKRFKEAPTVIRNLVTIGVVVTWILGTLAAYFFIGELHTPSGFKIALLFGALITVSGPTVIMPLLKIVKPTKKLATVLKWEGILVDPIGALLAVVTLTFIETSGTSGFVVREFLSSLAIGTALGGVAAFIVARLLKTRDFIPENTQNLVVLSLVLGVFALSNWLQNETGIIAVTVTGFVLGILKPRGLREIEVFKGQLTTLMVSMLFILLAARLDLQSILNLGRPGLWLLVAVLFVVRPINVFISSYKSLLTLREKLFLSWIAPRGIVAAAVASLFAETLKAFPEFAHQAEYIESLTFLIIAGTVFFQGATARLVGKFLKVIEPDPDGLIIVGANAPGRHLAKEFMDLGIEVLMLDSNSRHVSFAKKENIPAVVENAISQEIFDEVEIAGFGQLLAITPNDNVNVLVCQLWSHELGKQNVYRVGVQDKDDEVQEEIGLTGEGSIVFPKIISHEWLQHHLETSWRISRKKIENVEELKQMLKRIENGEVYQIATVQNKRITFYEPGNSLNEGEVFLFLEKKNQDAEK